MMTLSKTIKNKADSARSKSLLHKFRVRKESTDGRNTNRGRKLKRKTRVNQELTDEMSGRTLTAERGNTQQDNQDR